MTESNNSDYIEYYMLNAWWGNDWIIIAFCCICGVLFDPEPENIFNVYKVKDLFYCEKCYLDIQRAHSKRGIDWKGGLYWESLQSSSELK